MEKIKKLELNVHVQKLWGKEETYKVECPTIIDVMTKLNEVIDVINTSRGSDETES